MKSILTIDDNQQVHDILEPMLELWMGNNNIEMQVVKLNNGSEALSWVKEYGMPELVLLDVRMPVMGGAEFLRQAGILGYDLRALTLLLTGYADDLEEHLGTDALLMKHLRKPFMLEELFEALDRIYKRQ
ncbi:MAG: response regulator [Ghiorsea sp.]